MEYTLPPKRSLAIAELIEELKSSSDTRKLGYLQVDFHERFVNYLYKVALQKCKGYPDASQMAIDLVQDTFIIAFRKICTFNLNELDATKHEYIVKAWLGKIANHCFLKEYSKRKNVVYMVDYVEDLSDYNEIKFEAESKDESESLNQYAALLHEALGFLNDEQRTIILEYAREGCISSNLHLSPGKMDYLCRLYNTTPDNIRQIKKRTLDRLKKYCTQPRK